MRRLTSQRTKRPWLVSLFVAFLLSMSTSSGVTQSPPPDDEGGSSHPGRIRITLCTIQYPSGSGGVVWDSPTVAPYEYTFKFYFYSSSGTLLGTHVWPVNLTVIRSPGWSASKESCFTTYAYPSWVPTHFKVVAWEDDCGSRYSFDRSYCYNKDDMVWAFNESCKYQRVYWPSNTGWYYADPQLPADAYNKYSYWYWLTSSPPAGFVNRLPVTSTRWWHFVHPLDWPKVPSVSQHSTLFNRRGFLALRVMAW